jgi:hypothetical protein
MMLPPRTTINDHIALSFSRPDVVVFFEEERAMASWSTKFTYHTRAASLCLRASRTNLLQCNTPKRKISRGTASIPSVARARAAALHLLQSGAARGGQQRTKAFTDLAIPLEIDADPRLYSMYERGKIYGGGGKGWGFGVAFAR